MLCLTKRKEVISLSVAVSSMKRKRYTTGSSMKIAMLHWAFPPTIGGVESHLVMLGSSLVRRGFEVHLLTGSVGGRREKYVTHGMVVRRTPLLDLNTLTGMEKPGREVKAEILDFLWSVRPNVVHAHNFHYFSSVHAKAVLRGAAAAGAPAVLTAHNVWADELAREFGPFASRWDAVIAVSRFIARELVNQGYPAGQLTVIHHGIDLEKFKPARRAGNARFLSRLRGRRVIFHPARLSMDKGSLVAVKAVGLVRERIPDVLLLMAGPEKVVDFHGRQRDDLRKVKALVQEMGLSDNVLIRPFAWPEIADGYRAAEVCVYPSCFEEPFGIALLEAMATARPLVVTRAGGMPEVVEDGENGFLVPMGDHEELADKCLALLTDRQLSARMGRRGYEKVRERFSQERMVDETVRLYERLLGQDSLRAKWGI
ncbi:MAG: glycosyltransferase family 4 protein [Peptococcaceae bacterium]|jgi:glycosyltransferase involved in cell wall biosynthesis|nr:glycosyltransferase family 4 protein [Peptococcaceae bacterium]